MYGCLISQLSYLVQLLTKRRALKARRLLRKKQWAKRLLLKKVGTVTDIDVSVVDAELNDMLLLLGRICWESKVEREDNVAAEEVDGALLLLRRLVDRIEVDKLETDVEGSAGATTGGTCTFAPVPAGTYQLLILFEPFNPSHTSCLRIRCGSDCCSWYHDLWIRLRESHWRHF